jgi:hypothetical protein
MTHRKALIKLIEQNTYRHDSWRVFGDFVEMAAISLSNSVDLSHREGREARYLQIVRQYEREEVMRFAQMLSELVMEMEALPTDVLGEVFMEMDLGSKWHGQFFTPFHLCRAMAVTMVDDQMRSKIEQNGFIRVSEPACGGAAMVIALAIEMQAAGINYQRHMHVVAQDLDQKAVHMAYVQLSLMHIPAVVIHGNTLSLEERDRWFTPAHIIGGWDWKLSRGSVQAPAAEPVVLKTHETAQMSLFEEAIAA